MTEPAMPRRKPLQLTPEESDDRLAHALACVQFT
jgi:hypothetical protein